MQGKLIDLRKVGVSIKALRVANHLTQEELADRVGYSVRNLRRIENLGTGIIDVVNNFAETFNVSALDILNGCFLFIQNFVRKIKKHIGDLRHTLLTTICCSHICT